jgi:putative ABC transport system permease protein
MAAGMPFSYRFLDESFNTMYVSEQRVGKLAVTFALLAVMIACLGLFGLATYAAEQRTREIGIRKVLGASVGNLVSMLSKDFLKLVAFSALFAFPLAWWGMNHWLQDFAYRIQISWWIFLLATLIALCIAFATVGVQALKAALNNPVRALRNE